MNLPKFFAPLLFILPAAALAQTTQPQTPLLQQLNAETQDLYRSVKQGFVRVELPPPRWMQALNEANDPVQKWNNRLNAEVREKLLEARARSVGGGQQAFVPANTPATQPAVAISDPEHLPRNFVVPRPGGGFDLVLSGSQSIGPQANVVGPKVIGLILDQAGHVLLPIFIEKEAIADRSLTVIDSCGETLGGRFVGSDQLTGLTVLQLDRPAGRPIPLASGRPMDGSLVMLLDPSGDGGRLCVWTDGSQTGGPQDWGVAVGIDGSMHGFVRSGQFLCANAMRPLAEQLVRYGAVHRAALGVQITLVEAPIGEGGGQRALWIEKVIDGSAASAAGLKPGDLICSFAGTPVTDLANFSAAIAATNGRADLMILRDAHPMNISVELKPQ